MREKTIMNLSEHECESVHTLTISALDELRERLNKKDNLWQNIMLYFDLENNGFRFQIITGSIQEFTRTKREIYLLRVIASVINNNYPNCTYCRIGREPDDHFIKIKKGI